MSGNPQFWSEAVKATIKKYESPDNFAKSSFIKNGPLIKQLRSLSDEEIIKKRQSSHEFIARIAKNEWKKSHRIWKDNPNKIVSGHLNVSLLSRLLKRHSYSDTTLVDDIIVICKKSLCYLSTKPLRFFHINTKQHRLT